MAQFAATSQVSSVVLGVYHSITPFVGLAIAQPCNFPCPSKAHPDGSAAAGASVAASLPSHYAGVCAGVWARELCAAAAAAGPG
jgi:hypothetical protein